MGRDILTRRGLLKSAGVLGCSLAAHPLMTTVTFASAPWDALLVVIILRRRHGRAGCGAAGR